MICYEIQIYDMSKLSLIKVKFHRMNKLERRARKAFQIYKKKDILHTHIHSLVGHDAEGRLPRNSTE
jgi:hypothetical protein